MSNLESLSEEAKSVYLALDAYKVGFDLRETITRTLDGEYNKLQQYVEYVRSRIEEPTRPMIEGVLQQIETVWLDDKYEKVDPYVHKDGTWKYRTLLPKGYSSAKSVLLSAIEYNVFDTTSGKSELERKIREAKQKAVTILPANGMEVVRFFDDVERQIDAMLGITPDPLILGLVCGRLTLLKDTYFALAGVTP